MYKLEWVGEINGTDPRERLLRYKIRRNQILEEGVEDINKIGYDY